MIPDVIQQPVDRCKEFGMMHPYAASMSFLLYVIFVQLGKFFIPSPGTALAILLSAPVVLAGSALNGAVQSSPHVPNQVFFLSGMVGAALLVGRTAPAPSEPMLRTAPVVAMGTTLLVAALALVICALLFKVLGSASSWATAKQEGAA